MRAAVFEAYRTITVREVPTPEPAGDEVRLRVTLCGICGSDLSLFKTGIMSGPDAVLGHEIVGVVEGTGERVVPWPARGCGRCAWCVRGKPRWCLEPMDRSGGYAEHVTYPAANLVPVPGDLPDETAALAEPLGVALRGVELAEAGRGDVVYVSGLGSIGLLAAVAALDAGARVVGGDPREGRRRLALELGCEDAFDPTAEDPFWKLFAYDPLGPRVALECSGVAEAVQLAINTARHGGVVGLLGIPFEPTPIVPAVLAVKELRAFSISGPEKEHIERALQVLAQRPEAAAIATSTVGLDGVQDAMSALADGATDDVKVLIAP